MLRSPHETRDRKYRLLSEAESSGKSKYPVIRGGSWDGYPGLCRSASGTDPTSGATSSSFGSAVRPPQDSVAFHPLILFLLLDDKDSFEMSPLLRQRL